MKQPIVYDEGTNPGNGWRMPETTHWKGYHQFPASSERSEGYGSFEVFYNGKPGQADKWLPETKEGWYWWACFPGCLPDGEPSGPFPTAEGAYLDAIGE